MRLEQKSFAEKYIEKIVLLAAVLIAVGIVVMFVLDDYSVEVNGQEQSPSKIEEDIRAKATSLHNKVRSDQVAPEIDGFGVPNYVARFWARHGQKLLDQNHLPVQLVHRGPRIGGDDNVVGIEVEPVLPRPAFELAVRDSYHVVESSELLKERLMNAVADQYPAATLAEVETYVNSLMTQINELVGTNVPRDIRQVLVRAKIDLEKYKEALMSVDESVKMPKNWWEPYSNFIADVVVERQTLDPKTGEWGDLVEIKPIPGSISHDHRQQVIDLASLPVETDDQAKFKLEVTTSLIEQMRQHHPDVTKPRALDYKYYTPLVTSAEVPAGVDLTAEEQARLYDIRQKISDLEASLRRLTGSTGQRPGRVSPRGEYDEGLTPDRGSLDRPGTGRPTTGRPTTGRPTTGRPNDPNRPDPVAARNQRQQERIAELQKRLDLLFEEKAKLEGVDKPDPTNPDGNFNPRDPGNRNFEREQFNPRNPGERFNPRTRPRDPGALNEFGQPIDEGKVPIVDVWSHDLTVEHGKTYRYRVTYKMVNPLYQKDVKPEEVKKEYMSKLLIASEPSEWSEPISIEPQMYLFVNKASAQTNSATFELYSILDGRRMKHIFSASPGDPVGGTAKAEVTQPSADGKTLVPQTVDITVRAPYVLVDVKEPPKAPGAIGSRGPITVILADTATGEIFVRNLQEDIQDSQRKILDNEAARSSRTSVGLKR